MTIHDSKHPRNAADFYPTLDAPDVVGVLLGEVDLPPGAVWEPSAGAGHLVKELRIAGKEVIATDLHAYPPIPGLDVRIVSGLDFLHQTEAPVGVQTIVMNPPYGRADIDRHVSHALKLMRPMKGAVVVLARADWTYAARREAFVQDPGYAMKIELGWRLKWVEGTKVSGKYNYALHIWDFRDRAPETPYGAILRHGYRPKAAREAAGTASWSSGSRPPSGRQAQLETPYGTENDGERA